MEPVTCEVYIHPVSGLVFQMGDWRGLDEVVLKNTVKLTAHVPVRVFLTVALEDHLLGYAFLPQHPSILRHPFHDLIITV